MPSPAIRLVAALGALALLAPVRALAAKAMPLAQARELLAAGSLDELYLAFASLKPGAHPEGDAKAAAFLVEAAKAALDKDPTVSLGLADAGRRLAPGSAGACLAVAEAALALGQRGAAEEALEAARALEPKNPEIVWRRAVLAEQEGELELALKLLRSLGKGGPHGAEAAERAGRLAAALAQRDRDLAELKRLEEAARQRQREAAKQAGSGLPPAPPEPGTPPPVAGRAPSAPADAAPVPGMVARRSDHFRIVYSEGGRDFAQRARYEERVLELFERARGRVEALLGQAPAESEVVLYTKEEFALHFGDRFGGGVLGFYAGKIRMNYAEDPGERFYATAVHEYVHAAVDDLAGGHDEAVPVWLNEGLARWVERRVAGGDYVSAVERAELRDARRQGRLKLASLARTPFGALGADVGNAYACGSAAVQALAGTSDGLRRVLAVVSVAGAGTSFEEAFAARFGAGRLAGLDAEIDALLGN